MAGSTASSPLVGRGMMTAQLPRAAIRRDQRSRALRRALSTTVLGHRPADERDWAARIEARRAKLASNDASPPAGFEPGAASTPEWASNLNQPAPIWGVSRLFSIPAGWGTFQMRLVRELAPRSCLELGTALGLSAAYQAAALELNGAGKLTTLEGASAWAAVAQQGFAELGLADRVELRLGPIDDTLADVAREMAPIDYAFLDADHSEQATLAHFDKVLPHLSPTGVVILDDIIFSRGMRRAWKNIGRRSRVSGRFNLGRMGVVMVD